MTMLKLQVRLLINTKILEALMIASKVFGKAVTVSTHIDEYLIIIYTLKKLRDYFTSIWLPELQTGLEYRDPGDGL